MSEADITQPMPDVLGRETAYRGRRINVERLTVRTPDGREAVRDVVRHPGAAVILPITDDDQVVFVRNVRIAVGRALLELPAGTLEPPEPPGDCAVRELAEETGYRAEHIEPLARFYTAPGFCDEDMHAFVATGLTAGELDLDPGEQLVVEHVPWADAVAMAADGRLRDAKSIAVILAYAARRQGDA